MASETRVFVYGTLRSSCGNYRLLAGNTAAEYPAVLPGARLYASGIPYVTDCPDGGQVVGELMVLRPDLADAVLQRLDSLEGFRAGRRGNLYERVSRTILYRYQDTLLKTTAWVYLAGQATIERLTDDLIVADGDWLGRAS